MIKYSFWIGLCVLLCSNAYSQVITVLDQSGNPVEWATIYSNEPPATAVTDARGKADITQFEGSLDIQIRSIGYKPLSISYISLQNQGFLVQLSQSNLNLDEVVVSATRWQQPENAAVVSVVTPKQIAFQNPQTAADLLSLSGKVFVQKSQQGGGSPMIRGFATNRLIYSVDGVRMNNAIFRGGNIQNVINLDPFAVQQTEIVFGPGSVLYGSDAIGGVMHFTTLDPVFSTDNTLHFEGKAVARTSSANNERTGHADVRLGWKKWALVSSISSWDYDHLKQGSNGPDDYLKPSYVERVGNSDQVVPTEDPLLQRPSAYSQVNTMHKIGFKPNNSLNMTYAFHYSKTSSYSRYDRHNRTRNGTARYAEWDYGPQQWSMHHLELIYEPYNGLFDQMIAQAAYQQFEESRITRNFNDPEREVRTENVDAYSTNIDFIKSTGEYNTLSYGLEYVFNKVKSEGIIQNIDNEQVTDGPDRYPNADWQSWAAYIKNDYNLNDKTILQAGVRLNGFQLEADFSANNVFFNFPFNEVDIEKTSVSGSVGSSYRPSDNWVLNFNVGTAFRAPNVDDIGKVFDSEPGAVVVPNPDLNAENAYNIDLDVGHVFNDRIKVDIATYFTWLDNALVRRNFQINGQDSIEYDGVLSQVQAIQNAAKARVYGVQLGLDIDLTQQISWKTDLNVQNGEEELDDGSVSPSRHAAPFFGVTRLSYESKKFDAQVYVQFQGERKHEDLAVEERSKDEIYALDENGNTYSPSWYTLNLKAAYRFNQHFMLNAGIENITDQRYRPYSSGISGAGRNFILSLQVKF